MLALRLVNPSVLSRHLKFRLQFSLSCLSALHYNVLNCYMMHYLCKGFEQVGKAINVPPIAVLCGYIIAASFVMSPSFIEVTGIAWKEPILV